MKLYTNLIIALLVSTVLVLAYTHYQLRSDYEELNNLLNQEAIKEDVQLSSNNEVIYLNVANLYDLLQLKPFFNAEPSKLKENKDTRYKIMILLDIDDCSACFAEGSLWEDLYDEFENISVFAVVSGRSQAKIEAHLRGLNIDIPFFYDPDATFAKSMGLAIGVDTPIKLIIDKENKVINQSRTLHGNSEAHERYKVFVKSLLD